MLRMCLSTPAAVTLLMSSVQHVTEGNIKE